MELGQCSICGRVCIKSASGICMDCFHKQEENEKVITEYIKNHEQCSIKEIEDATGIDPKMVKRIVKNGRILVGEKVLYPCEWCGELISQGRLCGRCLASFSQDARKVVKELKHTPEYERLQQTKLRNIIAEQKKAEQAGAKIYRGMYSKDIERRRR